MHVVLVSEARGGAEALRAWCQSWADGVQMQKETRLWAAAILEATDRGIAAAPEPGESKVGAHGRKVRPIGLSEALVKLAENCCIEAAMRDIKRTCEPIQLGVATPDGCAVATRLLRAWGRDPD